MALLGVQGPVRTKVVDTADIVRDAWFRQLPRHVHPRRWMEVWAILCQQLEMQ